MCLKYRADMVLVMIQEFILAAVRRLSNWKATKNYCVVQTKDDGIWTMMLVVAVESVDKFGYNLVTESAGFTKELNVNGIEIKNHRSLLDFT